ncbi:MAG: hypothetical protein QOH24_1197, partial [Verrucomicrobiota bacterium]
RSGPRTAAEAETNIIHSRWRRAIGVNRPYQADGVFARTAGHFAFQAETFYGILTGHAERRRCLQTHHFEIER